MEPERSVQDRVLQAFLERLGEVDSVPPRLVSRLAELLSAGNASVEELLHMLHETVSDDAED